MELPLGFALLVEAASLALVFWLNPEACWVALRALWQLLAALPTVLLVFTSLFCVAVLSSDVAYLIVRLDFSEADVWSAVARPCWALAWSLVWLLQAPFWLQALPTLSPLLTHELANLLLTVHHLALRVAGSTAPAFPSVALAVSSDASHQTSILNVVIVRTALPVLYMLSRGVPADWRPLLILFLLDVLPTVLLTLYAERRLGRGRESADVPWELSYLPDRGRRCAEAGHADGQVDDEDCEVHGTCSICLSALCRIGGAAASAAAVSAGLQRALAPGLSVLRRRRLLGRGQASGISAGRVAAELGGNRLATTRCGHSFHSECLALAAEALPRCPQCRAPLQGSGPLGGPELPDEDTLDAQMGCLVFGLLTGGSLLFLHWLGLQLQVLADPEQRAFIEGLLFKSSLSGPLRNTTTGTEL